MLGEFVELLAEINAAIAPQQVMILSIQLAQLVRIPSMWFQNSCKWV